MRTEDLELIANYLGWEKLEDGFWNTPHSVRVIDEEDSIEGKAIYDNQIPVELFEFDTWNWVMPLAEKVTGELSNDEMVLELLAALNDFNIKGVVKECIKGIKELASYSIPEISQAVYSLEKEWLVIEFEDTNLDHIYMENVEQFEEREIFYDNGDLHYCVKPTLKHDYRMGYEVPKLRVIPKKGDPFFVDMVTIS